MFHIIGSIFEGFIQYALLGFIIALLLMFILLILLSARNRVRAFLMIEPLQNRFNQLCEFSDRLDENYIAQNPYGTAMWLTRLVWKGAVAAAGLMVLWIAVIVMRG